MKKNQQNKWKRDFLTIAGGQTVSLIGSAAVQFSLIWWLASETASPIMMSIAGVFAFLPQLVLGPFAGVWVDRLNRKTVIIAADLFIGLVALVFAFFFLFGNPPYWSVCLVLGIRGVGNVFHSPAIQAAVPMLVPQQELVRANGWSQFMQSGAFLLGPVLGAAMYTALPLWIILLSDLAGALVASATVVLVKIPDPERQIKQRPRFFYEMKEGAAAICQDRKLFIVTAATLVRHGVLRASVDLLSTHDQRLFPSRCLACQHGQLWLCDGHDALRHITGKVRHHQKQVSGYPSGTFGHGNILIAMRSAACGDGLVLGVRGVVRAARSQQQPVQHPLYRLYAGNHRPGTDGACFFPDRKPQFSDYAFGIAHSRPSCRKQGSIVVVFCFRDRTPAAYAGQRPARPSAEGG